MATARDVVALYSFIRRVVGESREEKRGNGGFAASGLDYRRDWRSWICFWNGTDELVSGSSTFNVLSDC